VIQVITRLFLDTSGYTAGQTNKTSSALLTILTACITPGSPDSSVIKNTVNKTGVRFPAGTDKGIFFHHRIQIGSGDHPVSYPLGTGDSFPVGKAVVA
jgi:hypothetical protein